jgi:hypothetical protein
MFFDKKVLSFKTSSCIRIFSNKNPIVVHAQQNSFSLTGKIKLAGENSAAEVFDLALSATLDLKCADR